MMKTPMKTLLILAFVAGFGWNLQAQGPETPVKEKPQLGNTNGAGTFVDKDKDGRCDNAQARQGNGRRRNFVDQNGDGLCDNKQNAGKNGGGANVCNKNSRQGKGNSNCCGNGSGVRNRYRGPAAGDDVKK